MPCPKTKRDQLTNCQQSWVSSLRSSTFYFSCSFLNLDQKCALQGFKPKHTHTCKSQETTTETRRCMPACIRHFVARCLVSQVWSVTREDGWITPCKQPACHVISPSACPCFFLHFASDRWLRLASFSVKLIWSCHIPHMSAGVCIYLNHRPAWPIVYVRAAAFVVVA